MAEEEVKKTSTKKEITIKQFLNTVSITPRDKWVVERMFVNNTDKKTQSAWCKVMDTKCEGINYKKN